MDGSGVYDSRTETEEGEKWEGKLQCKPAGLEVLQSKTKPCFKPRASPGRFATLIGELTTKAEAVRGGLTRCLRLAIVRYPATVAQGASANGWCALAYR